MKKRLFVIFFALLLSVVSVLPASAMSDMQRLIDGANLLSANEEADLLAKLNEISERQQVDIVVVTMESLEGATPMEAADDFYDHNGYGFGTGKDGILFLLSMEERDWCISTAGYGITAFTDAGQDYIFEKMRDDLKIGNYAEAFTIFAELCDDFITQARTGEPYDIDHLPKEPFLLLENSLVAFFCSFIISLIATGIMRSKLRTVYSKSSADDYIRKDSMQLTKKNDLLLYRHVECKKKPVEKPDDSDKQDNSNNSNKPRSSGGSTTHVSSSGVTHGGKSGKF